MAATNALDSLIIGGHNMMQFVMQPGMGSNTRSGGSRFYWWAWRLSVQCSSN